MQKPATQSISPGPKRAFHPAPSSTPHWRLSLGCVALFSILLFAHCTPTPGPESQPKSWVTTLPGSTTTSPRLATDARGNLYACGVFHGTLTLGQFQLEAREQHALYLAQLNAAGQYVWAHKVGEATSSTLHLSGCKVNRDGDLLLHGSYQKHLTLGDISLPSVQQAGITHAFLARVNAAGQVLWAHGIPGSAGAQGISLAVSPQGEIWWTGYFRGTANFQDVALHSAQADKPQMFLAHLDPAGKFHRVITIPGHSIGTSLQIDTSGRVTLAGIFQGMLIVGAKTHISRGQFDIFLLQLNKAARVAWSLSLGGKDNDNGAGIATGQDGQLYLHGTLEGSAQIGTTQHQVEHGRLHFLANINSQGEIMWSQAIEKVQQTSSSLYERLSVSVSAQNDVFLLTGYNSPHSTQSNFALSIIPSQQGATRQEIVPQPAPSGQGLVGNDLIVDTHGHAIITGRLQGAATLQQHQLQDTPSAFIWRTGE